MDDYNAKILAEYIGRDFEDLLLEITKLKPNDHSERDRSFAILKTDVEKCLAWYKTFCQ